MTQYATRDDLENFGGANAVALQSFADAVVDEALAAASEAADGYMRGRYSLPLLAWDNGIRMNVCYIAGYNLITQRGMNPAAGADITWRLRYEDAVKWFEGVQRQAVHPQVTETPVAAPQYQFPQVRTGVSRGWNTRRGVG